MIFPCPFPGLIYMVLRGPACSWYHIFQGLGIDYLLPRLAYRRTDEDRYIPHPQLSHWYIVCCLGRLQACVPIHYIEDYLIIHLTICGALRGAPKVGPHINRMRVGGHRGNEIGCINTAICANALSVRWLLARRADVIDRSESRCLWIDGSIDPLLRWLRWK